jgi:hypothetical protein
MAPQPARAQLHLVLPDGPRWLAAVIAEPGRDLELIDRLLQLQLVVARQGHRILLTEVDPGLQAVLELVGVAELLEDRTGTCRGAEPAAGRAG